MCEIAGTARQLLLARKLTSCVNSGASIAPLHPQSTGMACTRPPARAWKSTEIRVAPRQVLVSKDAYLQATIHNAQYRAL